MTWELCYVLAGIFLFVTDDMTQITFANPFPPLPRQTLL